MAAHWNAWFEHDNIVAETLELSKHYRFVLDISSVQRRAEAAAPVARDVSDVLGKAAHKAEFTVRVLLLGGVIQPRYANARALENALEVDIAKLERPDLTVDEIAQWSAQKLNTSTYLAKGSAGHVALDIATVNEGCGAMAISIWDALGHRPLDHVVYQFAVGDPGSCPSHGWLYAGLDFVLSISSAHEGADAEKADAAFHIFELPSEPRDQGSVVWFVDRNAFDSSRNSGSTGGVYAWQTQSSIGRYASDPSQLPALLAAAHDAATASANDERPYQKLAVELRKKLFSVSNDRVFGKTAREAEAAFAKLVNESARPAVILTRLAVSADTLNYLPLGLLAARADEPIFRKAFLTVQPLRRGRFHDGKACVDPWTLGLPVKLFGLNNAAVQMELEKFRLDSPPPPWLHAFVRSEDALRRELSKPESAEVAEANAETGPVRGEGIVLLAHHANGNLWFDKELDRLAQEHFERPFRRGSVAMLSACSVGGPGPLGYTLIERLNALNVDAMIVSPFAVNVEFGALLAINFIRQIDIARSSKKTPTIAELYAAASTETADWFKKQSKRDLHEMGLEFVLLGDPSIRLCAD